jgi:hypothetical protein
MPGAYVRIIPNTQRTYLGSRRSAVPKSFSKESSFVQASLKSQESDSEVYSLNTI